MKNRFVTLGDVTILYLDRRDGSEIEAAISTKDLPRVQEFPNKWCAAWRVNTQSYYVLGVLEGYTVYLHRWIMSPRRNEETDHKNNDTLNNTRDNLRNVLPRTNMRNRRCCKKGSR